LNKDALLQPSFFINTIIIGAGQSGLVTAYFLKKRGIEYLVLDENKEVGYSWLERYDSLKLFTNIRHNSLAGLEFPGHKNAFPTKDETAAYLQKYAQHFNIQVKFDTRVITLNKSGDFFRVETTKGVYQSKNVVVCTGAFHTPFIPKFSQKINPGILQLHSKEYKNSKQLKEGKVLVVGGGNSGVQIVEELVNEGREVYFSYRGELKRVTNHPFIVWLIFKTGFVHASKNNFLGRHIMQKGEVIIGTDLKKMFGHSNLTQCGSLVDASEYDFQFEKLKISDAKNVIWATGFITDYSWIKLPIFDDKGNLKTHYGITDVKGLYFAGSAWQRSRASWLIGGVSKDAKYITEKIVK
jgi:putative flavoprotein involved in K+ transport